MGSWVPIYTIDSIMELIFCTLIGFASLARLCNSKNPKLTDILNFLLENLA